jgi:hypothetical protein
VIEPLDLAAVDRILAKIPADMVLDLDRELLRERWRGWLERYRTMYLERGHMTTILSKPRERQLARIIVTAEDLKRLIEEELSVPWMITHLEAILRTLRMVEERRNHFGDMENEMRSFYKEMGVDHLSPFEDIIGSLRRTFEFVFDADASYTRNPIDRSISGTFIDFAEAALKELKIPEKGNPYSRASIARALTKVKRYGRGPVETVEPAR